MKNPTPLKPRAWLLALLMMQALSIVLLFAILRPTLHAPAAQPRKVEWPKEPALPKAARLDMMSMPPEADLAADLIDSDDSDAWHSFTYRLMSITPKSQRLRPTHADALVPMERGPELPPNALAYQEAAPKAGDDPFAALLGKEETDAGPKQKDARATNPEDGQPLNVTAAYEHPQAHKKHLAAVPGRPEQVDALFEAAHVAMADRTALKALLDAIPAENRQRLELLLRPDGHVEAIRLLRLHDKALVMVANDNGDFQSPEQDDRFDKLARTAVATDHPAGSEKPVPTYAGDEERRDTDLAASVEKEVSRIASVNGISLDREKSPSVDVLVRTDPEGQSIVEWIRYRTEAGDREFYRYGNGPSGVGEFYDPQGHSASRTLLTKPVANGRLGDGFGWRIHPILNRKLYHNGVDYAAPLGSPIVAAGDGEVVQIGSEWGYGRYVRIRHDAGYFTTYAHISRPTSGLRIGQRVKQGQPIAYIGSTGLSTGPHLYYELKTGASYRDPLMTALPAGSWLQGTQLLDFNRVREHTEQLATYLREAGIATHSEPATTR